MRRRGGTGRRVCEREGKGRTLGEDGSINVTYLKLGVPSTANYEMPLEYVFLREMNSVNDRLELEIVGIC
jgi:hypothetical protein